MATGKVDPVAQFKIEPLFGTDHWNIAGYNIAFTNSALWMAISALVLVAFMAGGAKGREVPGRWQMAVEGLARFVENLVHSNIGPSGRKYLPYIFSLFGFILFCNVLSLVPTGLVGFEPFAATSHFTVTGVLAIISFSIVLIVGFAKHGFHFLSLFVPHGTPALMVPIIFPIELISFLVRPFSLGLRLFVAMMAGHVLLDVLGGFVISGGNAGAVPIVIAAVPSFILMVGICALELLVAAIQAYVFALLTCVYLNDAENLH